MRTTTQKVGPVRGQFLTYRRKRLKLCEEESRAWNGSREGIKGSRVETSPSRNHEEGL
jgi:hypothetical protein